MENVYACSSFVYVFIEKVVNTFKYSSIHKLIFVSTYNTFFMCLSYQMFVLFRKMALVFVLLALSAFEASVMGHTYHLGACPVVEPVQDFEMNLVNIYIIKHWIVYFSKPTCLQNNNNFLY